MRTVDVQVHAYERNHPGRPWVGQLHGPESANGEEMTTAMDAAADETRTWGLTFLYFVSFGGFLALTAWLPTYWINLHHLSLTDAGILGGVGFSLLAAVARVGGGSLAERFGGEYMAAISYEAGVATVDARPGRLE